jgi:hypothetical protein
MRIDLWAVVQPGPAETARKRTLIVTSLDGLTYGQSHCLPGSKVYKIEVDLPDPPAEPETDGLCIGVVTEIPRNSEPEE